MPARKKEGRKAKQKRLPRLSKKKEKEQSAVGIPPLAPETDIQEEEKKAGDNFFDEDAMKEFSVRDEEEDADDESVGEGGEGEPAWDEDEY